MFTSEMNPDIAISHAMIEAIVREDIERLIEETEGRVPLGQLLTVLTEMAIGRRALEEGSPSETARDLFRIVRPLKEGRYLPF